MDIACLVFDDITALDAIGPYEVLSRLPSARFLFVSPKRTPVRPDTGCFALHAPHCLEEIQRADILLVPGGFGARKLMHDPEVLAWLGHIDDGTRLTATVCTGALLLAATGRLRNRRATTHWAFLEELAKEGAVAVQERVVRDGKYVAACGVSAGIDLSLTLALELCGRAVAEAIQLSIEYAPAPPLSAGRPEAVSAEMRERLYRRAHARDAELPLRT